MATERLLDRSILALVVSRRGGCGKNCGQNVEDLNQIEGLVFAAGGKGWGQGEMHEIASPSAVEFVQNSARLRAEHYREEASRFRSMAEAEPLSALRRHLRVLAREYEKMGASFDVNRR
jgi:hypothetical protein